MLSGIGLGTTVLTSAQTAQSSIQQISQLMNQSTPPTPSDLQQLPDILHSISGQVMHILQSPILAMYVHPGQQDMLNSQIQSMQNMPQYGSHYQQNQQNQPYMQQQNQPYMQQQNQPYMQQQGTTGSTIASGFGFGGNRHRKSKKRVGGAALLDVPYAKNTAGGGRRRRSRKNKSRRRRR